MTITSVPRLCLRVCEVATTVDDSEYIYAVDFNQIEDAVVLEKDFPEAASPGFGTSGP